MNLAKFALNDGEGYLLRGRGIKTNSKIIKILKHATFHKSYETPILGTDGHQTSKISLLLSTQIYGNGAI